MSGTLAPKSKAMEANARFAGVAKLFDERSKNAAGATVAGITKGHKRDKDIVMNKYDLLVIGSGPGGQRAVIQAAKLGKNVALIERREVVGGVTAHTGTVPSKTLREVVLHLSGWKHRGFYGQSYRLKERITAEDLTHRLETTVQHQIEVIEHQLYRNGVTVLKGTASFIDANTIRVLDTRSGESIYRGDCIVIATGTTPHRPDTVRFDGSSIIDSDGILGLKEIPRSLAVVGAGVIGVEYATIFSALDIKVTLLDQRPTMLDFVDKEIIEELTHDMRDRGIAVRLDESVESVKKEKNGRIVTMLKSGKRVSTDLVMFAAGRTGATKSLDLKNAGIDADKRGRLKVNEHFQTDVPHIYAVGDVIGFPALASTSAEQGRLAACHMYGLDSATSRELFPFGIYAVPEISTVGASESELREKGVAFEVGIARMRETARGQILGINSGLLKMLFGLKDNRLLGVHIIGEGATELVHIGQAAIALGGTLSYFTDSVFNYPTLAEAYKVAALDAWNRINM